MAEKSKAVYDESKIKTLSSLEHIRLRTGMYIGRIGTGAHPDDGCYVLLKEVVDNAIDEFIMGNGKEVHILGYWLDPEEPVLKRELIQFQKVRQQRIHDMVARINGLGLPLSVDTVLGFAQCASPGRPHLARALVAAVHATDYDQAFDRFLKVGRVAWVPKARMPAADAVRLIHGAGGVAVLAHPGLYRDDGLIPRVVEAGIDGLECWHTRHSASAAAHYERVAAEHGLVATGGSDCHGMAKDQPLIGAVRLPYAQVEALHQRRPVTAMPV